jgi:hypothetical protein
MRWSDKFLVDTKIFSPSSSLAFTRFGKPIAFYIAHRIENSLMLARQFCFNDCKQTERRKYEKINSILPILTSKSQSATLYFEFATFCDHSHGNYHICKAS